MFMCDCGSVLLFSAPICEDKPIPVTPEVVSIGKNKAKRVAKSRNDASQIPENSTVEPGRPAESIPPADGSPKDEEGPPYAWDRTIEEDRQKELAKAERERLARLPLPPPKAKTLLWPDFCEYWNSLRESPVAPCIRLYVQRWLPVLLPVLETDRFGMTKEAHPSDLRILPADGPLSEDLILQLGGVGDYTFRLNDTRRAWEQGTVCQSQLETKRLWDIYPPVFDLKRLDYDDKKNQVYIKFARARGILPREDEAEKQEADLAQANVVESVMQDARAERARADQLQREALARAEREANEAKEQARKAEAEAAAAKSEEPKPTAPASDLLNVVNSVATLAKSLQPARDDSLTKYLEVQAQREAAQRERDKEEREAARETAKLERKRADDLQAEVLADLKKKIDAPPPTPTTPPAAPTRRQMLEDAVAEQTLLKQLAGRGHATVEEEERPSKVDKWLEAAPIIAPVVQQFVSGIFQSITFGLQTWQQVSFNAALKNGAGAQPQPPTNMQQAPEPGKPIPPSAPQPTPEQIQQQQQMNIILAGVQKLIGPMRRALDNSKTGDEFAEQVIEYADEGRSDYDRIRNVAQTLQRIGMTVQGESDLEKFKNAAAYLFMQFPPFWQKVSTMPTFGTFLEEFWNFDEIKAQEEDQKK